MKKLLSLSALALLCACPPVAGPLCEADSGTAAVDAGEPDFEVQLRFVNLGRETVTLRLEGEDAGQAVPSLASVAKTGHVTLIKQRGTVEARNFLEDGGTEAVTLPFEFDTNDGEPATFVLKDTTPARISMNVTVAKQTQGATFGEKVRQSLAGVELDGGVDTGGDCGAEFSAPLGTLASIGLRAEPPPPDEDCPGTADALFIRPVEVDADATPYFVRGPAGELNVAWVGKVNAGLHAAGSAVASGASLLGGAVPGGALISAAVRRLYVLNAHGGALPATVAIEGVELATNVAPGALVRVKASVLAAAARKGVNSSGLRQPVQVSVTVGGASQSFTLGVGGGPCKPPMLCDFQDDEDTLLVVSESLASSATVMKSRHETPKNAVGNVRREIAFGTTSTFESRGCVAAFEGDDACAMGAAFVSSVGSLAGSGGGAAAASYAATGRLLYPPKAAPASGAGMLVGVEELGVVARRFVWSSPPGLTPEPGLRRGGFAIVAAGTVLDATAVDQRALFFVDTGEVPWAVQRALSR